MNGILTDKNIEKLFFEGFLISKKVLDKNQIQPASLDLRLDNKAYRIRSSFIPGPNSTVLEEIHRFKIHEMILNQGVVLETGCIYIIPFLEILFLPSYLSAFANPKSSTGRLDIFTRVIIDRACEFDKIPKGYCGPLYLEITPRTFPIIVRFGSKLSQIRFYQGRKILNKNQLNKLQCSDQLLSKKFPNISKSGLGISIDLKGNKENLVGYKSKKHSRAIDIDKFEEYNIGDFWDPIYVYGTPEIILNPDEFYIFVSHETVYVPPLYAAEMTCFDALFGEFRVHYAGFFDPGFGVRNIKNKGSRAVLEIRNREIPFIVKHGQIIARLVYEKMLDCPRKLYGKDIGSNYQGQEIRLSKQFRNN